jgi:hypothetical protein
MPYGRPIALGLTFLGVALVLANVAVISAPAAGILAGLVLIAVGLFGVDFG